MTTTTPRPSDPNVRLTPREAEVLKYVAQGTTSHEIGEILFVTFRTVDYHLANVYAKLEVNSRLQAVRKAIQLGIMPDTTAVSFAR